MEFEEYNLICEKHVSDGNGGFKLCGCTKHTLSGNNGWITIQKASRKHPAIKVLKQRFVCKECGGFNFRHLDGSVLKLNQDYTEDEIQHLVKLTKQKLSEKGNLNNVLNS